MKKGKLFWTCLIIGMLLALAQGYLKRHPYPTVSFGGGGGGGFSAQVDLPTCGWLCSGVTGWLIGKALDYASQLPCDRVPGACFNPPANNSEGGGVGGGGGSGF